MRALPALALTAMLLFPHPSPAQEKGLASPGEKQQAPDPSASVSMGEARIRAGIVMLSMLHDAMAKVKDHASAEAAVPSIMRLSNELQAWGRGFNNMPPLDASTQSDYEKKYIPVIQAINDRIKAQGERLAAAEFYGSQDLPAALVRLANALQ